MAGLTTLDEAGRGFRGKAFEKAFWALDDVPDLDADPDRLRSIAGFGATVVGLVQEFRRSGRLARLEELRVRYPRDATILQRARTMTPARLRDLKATLGIDTVEEFASALDTGAVSDVRGVGPATVAVWERWLDEVIDQPTPQWVALAHAGRLAAHAERLTDSSVRVVRRIEPWTDEITLVGGPRLVEWQRTTAMLDPTDPTRVHEGPRLSIVKEAPVSADIPPIRSDLHVHSRWSPDGRQDVDSIMRSAGSHRLEVVAITDHGPDLHFGGMTESQLVERSRALRAVEGSIEVLVGAELNIGVDGGLDFDEAIRSELDIVVAGVHSHFDLDTTEQTSRVVAALHRHRIDVLAHPRGRRVGIRPPLQLDMDAVYEAAATTGTALEVNGHLDRLDLDAEAAREAAVAGCLIATNSDSHRPEDFDNLATAALVAAEAAIPHAQIVNTWTSGELRDWLER